MESFSNSQKILAILILITIVFFSFFHITESPPFGFDEGWALHIASNIAQTGIDGTQFSPGDIGHASILSVGYTLIYAEAFWLKLFGIGIFQARTMMIVYMLAFAIASFVLLRRLYGNNIALGALAILATFPPFYSFGKSVVGEVPVLFFLILFLLFFNVATSRQEKNSFWLIMAGMSAGLCIITKTMALAFIPVLFITAFLAYRKKLVTWKDIFIVVISTIIPIIVWLIVNFQPGDSVSQVLDYYTNPSALTNRTATFWLNIQKFFIGIGPIYMLSLMIIWISGIIIRLKTKVKIHSEELIALTFSILLIMSFLFRYWDARYLFPVQVLGILFAPYSLYLIFDFLATKFSWINKTKFFTSIIIILFLLGLYQTSFSSYIADSYKSTRNAELADYFSNIPISTPIFFYNTPNVILFFHGHNYYQRIAIFEKWVVGHEYASIVTSGKADMLVLNHPMTKSDEKISLDKYSEIKKFGETMIYQKKTQVKK